MIMGMRKGLRWAAAVACAVLLAACSTGTGSFTPTVEDTIAAKAAPRLLPEFERIVLPGGTVVLLAPKRDVPLVSLTAIMRGGAVTDTSASVGVAALTASLLEKGAGSRSAAQFVDDIAAVGGGLSSSAGLESARISGEFLSEDAPLMIELVADMLKAPRFDAAEFEKLRTRSIESLRAARDGDPRSLVGTYGRAFLFDQHPYGNATGGTEETLATLTLDDIRTHHRAHYGADRLIISVVGDFDLDLVRSALRDAFGAWRAAQAPRVEVAAPVRAAGGRVLLIDKPDATQSYFWIGNVGVSRTYENSAALDVANTIFGGRFTSMLNSALRIETGLTYGASSRVSRPSQNGSVSIVSFTATDTTLEAIDLALATLVSFRDNAVEPALLNSAKVYIRGQNPLGLETASQVSGQLATLAFYDLGRDEIDQYGARVAAVGSPDMSSVVQSVYPAPEDLVFVVIGNAAAISKTLSKYGHVAQMSLTEPRFSPR